MNYPIQGITLVAKLQAERDELRECVAMASVIIRRIGSVDANATDNIRRAEKWFRIATAALAKTEPKPMKTIKSYERDAELFILWKLSNGQDPRDVFDEWRNRYSVCSDGVELFTTWNNALASASDRTM